MATASAERDGILPLALDLFEYTFGYFGLKDDLPDCFKDIQHGRSRFTEEIGEAVLGISYAFRIAFKKRFNELMPELVETEVMYKHLMEVSCKQFMYDVFKISSGRVMRILIVFAVSAFVSELSVFGHRRGMTNALEIAPSQFKFLFDKHVAPTFFGAGGWPELHKEAEKLSRGYKKLRATIDFDPEIEVDVMTWEQLTQYFQMSSQELMREEPEGAEGDGPEQQGECQSTTDPAKEFVNDPTKEVNSSNEPVKDLIKGSTENLSKESVKNRPSESTEDNTKNSDDDHTEYPSKKSEDCILTQPVDNIRKESESELAKEFNLDSTKESEKYEMEKSADEYEKVEQVPETGSKIELLSEQENTEMEKKSVEDDKNESEKMSEKEAPEPKSEKITATESAKEPAKTPDKKRKTRRRSKGPKKFPEPKPGERIV